MGISYSKRKSGRWQARVRVKGKPSKSKTTATKKEAQQWALKTLQELQSENGENPFIMDYLKRYAEERKDMLTRYNSKQGWNHMVHIAHRFFEVDHPRKGERIKDIDRTRYKEYALYIGRHFSQNSAKRLHQFMKAAFEDAKADHLIEENPADFVATRDITGVASAERTVEHPIGREDTQRIIKYILYNRLPWAHIKGHKELYFEPGYNLMILAALMTGAREGELAGLRIKDMKLAKNNRTGEQSVFFDINHQVETSGGYSIKEFIEEGEQYDKGTPFSDLKIIRPLKTNESKRIIKVPGILCAVLTRGLLHNTTENPEAPLFKTRAYKTMNRSSLSLYIHRLLDELGINSKGYHFHSLRHTHVAILLDRGLPLEAISKRLGHATVQMTLKKYAYTVHEKEEQDENAIAENLDQMVVEPIINTKYDDVVNAGIIDPDKRGLSTSNPSVINHKKQLKRAKNAKNQESGPWTFEDFFS